MSITINGQLCLCMLAEMLSAIPKVKMLQANTDGLTIRLNRKYLNWMENICKEWEQITNLELEKAYYNTMILKDVNNYLSVYDNGKIKRKGAFEYNRDYSDNTSMMIVPKAIEAFYVNNTPVEEFVLSHKDIYDFFKRVKLSKSHSLVGRSNYTEHIEKDYENSKRGKSVKSYVWDSETQYSNISRYLVTTSGETLLKIMPPLKDTTKTRKSNVEVGYLCQVHNDIRNVNIKDLFDSIDYEYYINECYKIINAINSHKIIENDIEEE